MTAYLVSHFELTVILGLFALFISKKCVFSNKLQLFLLYLILVKSILPWGIVDLSSAFLQTGMDGGGFSCDLPVDIGILSKSYVHSAMPHGHLIFSIWLSGFALGLFFMFRGLFAVGAKIKSASPCTDPAVNKIVADCINAGNTTKSSTVLVSDTIDMPFVWWCRHWFIVLPNKVLSLNEMEQKVILAHELTHIQRNDFIKFLLLKCIKTAFFFSPLVWFVVSEILIREETQTDLKTMQRFDITPYHFGKTILRVISIFSSTKYPVPTLIGSTKRRLKMRLEGLFPKKSTTRTKWIQAGMVLSMIVTLMLNFSSSAMADKGAASADFINPLVSGKLTLGFGMKTHPITKEPYRHQGIDLAAKSGTAVVSPAAGTVVEVNYNDKRGHYLILQHDNGYKTVYSHLSEILVANNSMVIQGEEIATVGNSGLSTGPHLHFEVHLQNEAIDPLMVFQTN